MKAVVFDRDGVIVDSESVNVNAAVEALRSLGVDIADKDQKIIVGKHPDDYVPLLRDKYDFPESDFRRIQSGNYHAQIGSAPLIDATISLIRDLYRLNVPLALTTSSSLESTLGVLKRAGLEEVFKVIVTYEDCTERKPLPQPYQITAERLGLSPNDCVAIEDTTEGVTSAKEAGMKCIAAPNRWTDGQDFSRADYVVNSAGEITIEMLRGL